MRLAVALAAAAAVLLAPAGARGDVLVRDPGGHSPMLTGDGLAWLHTGEVRGGSETVLRTAREGGSPASAGRVGEVDEDDTDAGYDVGTAVERVAASGARVAVVQEDYSTGKGKYTGNGTVAERVLVVDGAARRIVRTCGEEGGLDADLDGDRLVLTRCGGRGVDLLDLARTGEPARPLSETGNDPRVAGGVAAWREGDAIVVVDLAAGREVLRAPVTGLPGPVAGYEVQADGKLAVAVGERDAAGFPSLHAVRVAWTGPGRSGFTIVDPGGRFAALRIAGDRLALHRTGALDAAVVLDLAGRTVASTPFHGGRPPDYPAGFVRAGRVDFDGRRLALAAPACGGWALTAFDLTTLSGAPSVDACGAPIARSALRVRRRRATVGVGCPPLFPARAADRCRVSVVLRARGRRLGSARAVLRTGSRGVRVAVPGRALRRARRAGARRVTVRVRNRMRGGTRVTTRTVRLRIGR